MNDELSQSIIKVFKTRSGKKILIIIIAKHKPSTTASILKLFHKVKIIYFNYMDINIHKTRRYRGNC